MSAGRSEPRQHHCFPWDDIFCSLPTHLIFFPEFCSFYQSQICWLLLMWLRTGGCWWQRCLSYLKTGDWSIPLSSFIGSCKGWWGGFIFRKTGICLNILVQDMKFLDIHQHSFSKLQTSFGKIYLLPNSIEFVYICLSIILSFWLFLYTPSLSFKIILAPQI